MKQDDGVAQVAGTHDAAAAAVANEFNVYPFFKSEDEKASPGRCKKEIPRGVHSFGAMTFDPTHSSGSIIQQIIPFGCFSSIQLNCCICKMLLLFVSNVASWLE